MAARFDADGRQPVGVEAAACRSQSTRDLCSVESLTQLMCSGTQPGLSPID